MHRGWAAVTIVAFAACAGGGAGTADVSAVRARMAAPTGPCSPADTVTYDKRALTARIERPAVPRTTVMLEYPSDAMRGEVIVGFVVDPLGRVEAGTRQILASPDIRLSEAVCAAVSDVHFYPGETAGERVRSYIEMPFRFGQGPPGA